MATPAAKGDAPNLSVAVSWYADLTLGRLKEDVPVSLNRMVTEYDHVLICGPVFPH